MLSNNDNDQLLSKPHGIEEQGVKSTHNLVFSRQKNIRLRERTTLLLSSEGVPWSYSYLKHSLLDWTTADQGILDVNFCTQIYGALEHVAQNQGKTTNRAQPLTPIFRINILQQGFTVKGSSAYTIKKWFLWLVVRLIVCGLRIMMNHLTSCWLVVACVHYRTIP